MTHNDYTKNILNIKDPNIHFEKDCLEVKVENGKTINIFHGTLSYKPKFCCNCGSSYKNKKDYIKYGFDKNCLVKVNSLSNINTILLLDKQRFHCKHCNSTFNARTDLVDFHKQISNNTKLSVILDLMEKSSEKEIAKKNNVSTNTVNRILHSISEDKIIKNNGKLPEAFGIDEFTATKDTKGKYAFIIVDQTKDEIFDILDSRKSKDIEAYFSNYPRQERMKVKFITMDLYKPYYTLMHKLFPNAILIPDRFHFVIQARNAFDITRIKTIAKSNKDYKKYKTYWKLLLKDENELDDKEEFYSSHFRKKVTQKYIVTYLVNANDDIKYAYNYYQGILHSIKNKDSEKFLNIITHFHSDSKYLNRANKTFIEMKKYLLNSFNYELSNGIVEGFNNLIKMVKHNACGYRKFKHLKTRIMLIKGYLNPIKA